MYFLRAPAQVEGYPLEFYSVWHFIVTHLTFEENFSHIS